VFIFSDGEPSLWPGHHLQFGSVGSMAKPVEMIESIRPTTFANRYIRKQLPVVLKGRIG